MSSNIIMDSTETSMKELKQKMGEIYQCTVCHNVPRRKVIQCPSGGHIMCERCSGRLSTCPVCREPLEHDITKRIRNLAVEQSIEALNLDVSCGNDGCSFTGPKRDLVEHNKCQHIPCNYRGCQFTGSKNELKWHRHWLKVREEEEQEVGV